MHERVKYIEMLHKQDYSLLKFVFVFFDVEKNMKLHCSYLLSPAYVEKKLCDHFWKSSRVKQNFTYPMRKYLFKIHQNNMKVTFEECYFDNFG